jgi:hypothetical protein
MARSLGALLKKQSSSWVDDEPKKAKAAGEGRAKKGEKGEGSAREKKEKGEKDGNIEKVKGDRVKDKDKDKDKMKDRESDRETDREKNPSVEKALAPKGGREGPGTGPTQDSKVNDSSV